MNFDFFMDIFSPPVCVFCEAGVDRGAICDACRAKIVLNQTLFCGKCGARLPEAKKICHPDVPYLLGAAADYDTDELKTLVHALKFRGIRLAAEPLADILIEYVSRLGLDLSDYVAMPLPLSRKREFARGFNQSELIAKRFAARVGIPLETKALARIKHSKPQSETENIFERRENIRGCFSVAASESVEKKKIILIDDVTTSGTTFLEAAETLRACGTRKILALACAKA